MTTASDLRYELLAYPPAVVVGGHGIRPFVDYGERGRDFKWVTILRDPVARIFSHYVYDLGLGRAKDSFEGWIQGDVSNYQERRPPSKNSSRTMSRSVPLEAPPPPDALVAADPEGLSSKPSSSAVCGVSGCAHVSSWPALDRARARTAT